MFSIFGFYFCLYCRYLSIFLNAGFWILIFFLVVCSLFDFFCFVFCFCFVLFFLNRKRGDITGRLLKQNFLLLKWDEFKMETPTTEMGIELKCCKKSPVELSIDVLKNKATFKPAIM